MNKKELLTETFLWLFIGLLICFGVSFVVSFSETIFYAVYNSFNGAGAFIFVILEIVCALALTFFIKKLDPKIAKLLYILYTMLTGLSFNWIFVAFTRTSISMVFLATSIIFGIFALIGKHTKTDLTKWTTFLFVSLLAIIILEIINVFVLSSSLNIILCIVTILLFSAYVAYDIQRLLNSNYLDDCSNKSIYFAFQLFLDFINIFIKLLRLFGKNRD